MTTVDNITLTLPGADVDGDGNAEVGVFELLSDPEVSSRRRTGYLVEPGNEDTTGLAANYLAEGSDQYQSLSVNVGLGAHVWEVSARNWTANDLGQWGDGSSSAGSVNAADATGGTAKEMQAVWDRYITAVAEDSTAPAKLEILGWGSDASALYDGPVDVTLEQPEATHDPEQPAFIDVSFTAIKVLDASSAFDRAAKVVR